MSLLCTLGGHRWNGCKCENCFKKRDERHHWNGCRCTVCGEKRDVDHHWKGVIVHAVERQEMRRNRTTTGPTTARCAVTAKKSREVEHAWVGPQCWQHCGKCHIPYVEYPEHHEFDHSRGSADLCTCIKCDRYCHDFDGWSSCWCLRCRQFCHSFVSYAGSCGSEQCERCGETSTAGVAMYWS